MYKTYLYAQVPQSTSCTFQHYDCNFQSHFLSQVKNFISTDKARFKCKTFYFVASVLKLEFAVQDLASRLRGRFLESVVEKVFNFISAHSTTKYPVLSQISKVTHDDVQITCGT